LIERVSPHDLDAERAILGAVLVDGSRLHDVAELIVPGDFFREAHRSIFEAMRTLDDARQPIDLLTLKGALGSRLEDAGGLAYIAGLGDGMSRGAHVQAHCQIVKQAALRRRLQAIGTQTIAEAGDAEIEAQSALERSEAAIYELRRTDDRGDLRPIDTAMTDAWPVIERAVDEGRPAMGRPTGLADLDRQTLGLHPGNLAILAARPGMGKSALALQIAYHVASSGDETVAFFSLEMSREELVTRLLGTVARVNMHRMMLGKPVHDDDMGAISVTRAEIGASRLLIDDTSTQTVASVRGKARRLKAKSGLGLVVVDYLQLMASERRYDNRVVEIGAMSRGLKQLAGELECPILALSQLNRSPDARSDGKPRLSDLRESGSLEQDANTVWLIHLTDRDRQSALDARDHTF
jgi:replicative DNA helicase